MGPKTKKKQCQAYVESTSNQCRRNSIKGSRYCWSHQSKVPIIIGFLVGIVTSLILPKIWEYYFPSDILKNIEENTAYMPEISQDLSNVKRFINDSVINVCLEFSVVERDVKLLDARMFGSTTECYLVTRSGDILKFLTTPGTIFMKRSTVKYEFTFKANLPPESNIFRDKPEEFYKAQKIKIPLKKFVDRIRVDSDPSEKPILSKLKCHYFVNNREIYSLESAISKPIDESSIVDLKVSEMVNKLPEKNTDNKANITGSEDN